MSPILVLRYVRGWTKKLSQYGIINTSYSSLPVRLHCLGIFLHEEAHEWMAVNVVCITQHVTCCCKKIIPSNPTESMFWMTWLCMNGVVWDMTHIWLCMCI